MFASRAVFQPFEIAQFTTPALSRVIRPLKPRIIFHAASLQSPWESADGENGWTQLVRSAGFGITLPLQMALAAETARAAGDSKAAIVNACYPDCVNPALHRLGLRATCGIGNSAIIEAFCRAHPKNGTADVRVIAHHGHLSAWLRRKRARYGPRVWLQGRETDAMRFSPGMGAVDKDLNDVTSSTAVAVILSLLSGEPLKISIPGVADLPGGYPFLLQRGTFRLRLPRAVAMQEAMAQNKTGERADGLDLGAGVKFLGKAREALAAAGFAYAQGFDLKEWESARDRMAALRERLRKIKL